MQPNMCTVKHSFAPSILKNWHEILLNTYASLQQQDLRTGILQKLFQLYFSRTNTMKDTARKLSN